MQLQPLSLLKQDSVGRRLTLEQSNKMAYAIQKLPESVQETVIEKILSQENQNNDSNLHLKPTASYKKKFIQKEGTLKIKAKNWLCCFGVTTSLQPKRCKLKQNILRIGQRSSDSCFYLCFDVLTVEISRISPKEFKINVPGNQQHNFCFEALNQVQCEQWMEALEQSISTSYGQSFQLREILAQPNFNSFEYIAQRDFVERSNCGDILLLKGDSKAGTFQRLMTLSEFDHVAVVLKNRSEEVFIFESTSSAGVSILPWKFFIKYRMYDSIEKIVWRQLQLQLLDQDIDNMEAFILKNLNKGYGLSLQKLFKMQSATQQSLSDAKEISHKTYFCSELVASLYKALGLLEKTKSATQYWPVTFAKDLNLLRGWLGHPKTIVFEYDLINVQRF